MSFIRKQFGKSGAGGIKGQLNDSWTYWHTTDTYADIISSGYFDEVSTLIEAYDRIYCNVADATCVLTPTTGSGVTPVLVSDFSIIKYGVRQITWSGGLATLFHPDALAQTGHKIIASFHTTPTESAYIREANVSGAGTVYFELSTPNTSNDAVINYILLG